MREVSTILTKNQVNHTVFSLPRYKIQELSPHQGEFCHQFVGLKRDYYDSLTCLEIILEKFSNLLFVGK